MLFLEMFVGSLILHLRKLISDFLPFFLFFLDRDKMIELIRLPFSEPCAEIIKSGNCSSDGSLPIICNKILQLLLCLLDMPQSSSYIFAMELAPVLQLEHSRYCLMISFCVCH